MRNLLYQATCYSIKYFLILLFFNFSSYSQQQQKLNNLKKKLITQLHDTNEVKLLCEIAHQYKDVDYSVMIQYAEKAFFLSKRLNYIEGIITSIGCMSSGFKSQGNFKRAIDYQLKALDMLKRINNIKKTAAIYNNVGIAYMESGNSTKAIEYYNYAIKISKKTNNVKVMASSLSNLGLIFMDKGDYKKAIDQFLDAITFFDRIKDYKNSATCDFNIGNIYFYMMNYSKALSYYNKTMVFREQTFDVGGVADCINNIGNIYYSKREYSKALNYYFEALKKRQKMGRKNGVISCLVNIGVTYAAINKNDTALTYLYRADSLNTLYGSITQEIPIVSNIAKIYLNKNKNEKALLLFERYLTISKALNWKEDLKLAYYNLAEVNKRLQHYQKAYENMQAYVIINDSLTNKDNNDKISEMIFEHQLEKKEQEIVHQKQENAIAKLSLKQHRAKITILVIGILFLILFILFIHNKNQLKYKKEIEREKTKLHEQMLAEIIERQEVDRNRLAKDLHDGTGQLLTALKLSLQDIFINTKNISEEVQQKIKKSNTILDQSSSELRSIAYQMMPRVLSESGLVFAIDELLKNTLSQAGINFQWEHYKLNERYNSSIEINIYRIAQELITNIIKHARCTEVCIQLFVNSGYMIFMVEDNGLGIKEENTRGSGLINIQSRALALKGEFTITSSPQIGTLATLRIPITI